jgi:hypothetical protein
VILQDFHTHQFDEAERLGRSVRYPFYSIFKAVQARPQGGLSIQLRRDRPAQTRQSGIYVWHHPDWGYFYVGIAAADNFTERWNKHIQKLLDQCTSAKQMANWKIFADKFRAAGYGIDDLKNVTLRFYPRPNPGSPTFKQELSDLETRIVGIINPACNREYDPTRPTATRFPTQRPLEESSGYSLSGSFTRDLIASKIWLLSELEKIQKDFSTIYILGSWYGNLALYMKLQPRIKVDRIINVEKNVDMLDTSQSILDRAGADNVKYMLANANQLDYRQLGDSGVVINTSLTDMPGRGWFLNIPDDTLIVMQARNNDSGEQFNSTRDIVEKFPLSQVLYHGSMQLRDPETEYTRYMVIGRK